MKEFTSNIVMRFSINNLEAENKYDYIEKLKEQFCLHGLELQDNEIQDIQEIELHNEKNLTIKEIDKKIWEVESYYPNGHKANSIERMSWNLQDRMYCADCINLDEKER